MSESREHKRRYNLRLEFIAEVGRWLDREPPMILFWKWHKWKKERPIWEKFSKKEFSFQIDPMMSGADFDGDATMVVGPYGRY